MNVYAVHSKKVYISGDGIARTGYIDLVVATHVSEVIAAMGGFSDFANRKPRSASCAWALKEKRRSNSTTTTMR